MCESSTRVQDEWLGLWIDRGMLAGENSRETRSISNAPINIPMLSWFVIVFLFIRLPVAIWWRRSWSAWWIAFSSLWFYEKRNRLGFVWSSNELFFCFWFFFDCTSGDGEDADREEDDRERERETDDDRVRLTGFLFFFVSLIGDFFDFEEVFSFVGGAFGFDTGCSLLCSVVFFPDGLFGFLCDRSTLESDDGERFFTLFVAWGEVLLAMDEEDGERWWCLSLFREGFTGLRLCGGGDLDGKRWRSCRLEEAFTFFLRFSGRSSSSSLSLLFKTDRVGFLSLRLKRK